MNRNPNALDVRELEDAEGTTMGLPAAIARRNLIKWNHICDEYGDERGKRVLSR